MTPTIAIIGAHGKMGRAFSKLFESRGIEVLEADMTTDITPQEATQQADIVIFSVPISSTTQLISDLAPLAKPDALLTDFTSIKSPAVSALEEHAPASCEIMGLHPLFGPGVVPDLAKQVFVSCPLRSGPQSEFLLEFFRSEGAIIKETSAEEHDKMMSVVQGLTHLSAIATAIALKDLGFDLHESFEFSSPVYRLRLEMVGRILSQSSQLYAEIALENPLTIKTVQSYQQAINELSKMVKKHDMDGFKKAFEDSAEFLGDFKDEAYQRTTELIQRSKDIL